MMHLPQEFIRAGYARATENVTITNCYVTGNYQLGTLLDGTFKPFGPEFKNHNTGRIKFGTESNGGFKNITVSNCVLMAVADWLWNRRRAVCEDITFVGSRCGFKKFADVSSSRHPHARTEGRTGRYNQRILISNVTSSGTQPELCSIISASWPCHRGLKVSDVYLRQLGGGTREMANLQPEEKEDAYRTTMFGPLPATGSLFATAKYRVLEHRNSHGQDRRESCLLAERRGSADSFALKRLERCHIPPARH